MVSRVWQPFKQSIQWKKAVVLLPPERLKVDGLIPTLNNISLARVSAMQRCVTQRACHATFMSRDHHVTHTQRSCHHPGHATLTQ